MRRAAMALVVLGLLGTGAAGCSLSANHAAQPGSAAGQATSMDPTVQASLADTRNLCDAVGNSRVQSPVQSDGEGTDSQNSQRQRAERDIERLAMTRASIRRVREFILSELVGQFE